MGTLVENAKRALERTSASQVEEWNRCPRRWYNAQVLGLRTPATPAMMRGTSIHSIIEARLLGQPDPVGADPDHVRRVESGIQFFPRAGKAGLEVEQWLEMPTFAGGPKFVGRYDAIDWDHAVGASELSDFEGVGVVNYDAKTTSDFRYAKTPAELADNIQMGVYGKHVMLKRPDVSAMGYRHVYIRTRGAARSMPVDVVVTRAQVEARWGRTLGLVKDMADAARAMPLDAQDLPANTASCGAFGGCPYRRLCGLDGPVVEFEVDPIGRFTDHAQAVLDKMEAKAESDGWYGPEAKEPAAPAAPIENENEEKNMSTTNGAGEDLMAKLRNRSAGKTVGAVVTPTPPAAAKPVAPAAAPVAKPAAPTRVVESVAPTTGPVGCPACKGKRYVKSEAPGAAPGAFVACKTCGGTGTMNATAAAKLAQAKPAIAPKPAAKKAMTDEEKIAFYEVRAQGHGAISTREAADGSKSSGWVVRQAKTPAEVALCDAFEALQAEAATGGAQIEEEQAEAAEASQVAESGDGAEVVDYTAAEVFGETLIDETAADVGASGVVPPDAPARTNQPEDVVEKPKKTKAKAAAKAPAPEPPAVASMPHNGASEWERGAKEELAGFVTSKQTTVPAKAKTGPRIYVDCMPTKGADKALAVSYEEWLAPLMSKAAAAAVNAKTGQPQPVQDWRLADYGSGEGLLAVAIREALPTLPEVVIVSGISKARGVFLEQVVPGASLVVKGF